MLCCLALAALPLGSCQDEAGRNHKKQIVWYVDPVAGDDAFSGLTEDRPWRSFLPLEKVTLGPGDEVRIAAGQHSRSLVPRARGAAQAPATIRFLPGLHEFSAEGAVRCATFVSNSCTTPQTPMPVAILVADCEHLQILGAEDGPQSTLLMGGRMTHFINDRSRSISYRHLVFDLKRPTVSEFRVVASGGQWADIRIARASSHELKDNRIVWTGDIGGGQGLLQQAVPGEGRAWRTKASNNPLTRASRIESLNENHYRLHFDSTPPPQAGHHFQWRHVERDVVGAHNTRCHDLRFSDCTFHAFAGMGIISQFTDTIHLERVHVVPPPDTLRTCPAWADVFHFSGCRGQITVKDSVVSGTQDDMVNVHGTYLRIIEQRGENRLLLRFMHPQTHGFAAFQAGDEIAVIDHKTLRELPDNPRRKVRAIERASDQDWLLTLDGPAPRFRDNDVIDNLSWHPDVTVSGCRVDMNSCRGLLLSSRGRIVVEHNTFHRCRMAAILMSSDAGKWFESGPVRDVVIRQNTFVGCGIEIDPSVSEGVEPVHENIRIIDNTFSEGAGIHGHHAAGLVISGNRTSDAKLPIKLDPASTRAVITNNRAGLKVEE